LLPLSAHGLNAYSYREVVLTSSDRELSERAGIDPPANREVVLTSWGRI
jgi:hypothetical protein